jgi:hypothetical protein
MKTPEEMQAAIDEAAQKTLESWNNVDAEEYSKLEQEIIDKHGGLILCPPPEKMINDAIYGRVMDEEGNRRGDGLLSTDPDFKMIIASLKNALVSIEARKGGSDE